MNVCMIEINVGIPISYILPDLPTECPAHISTKNIKTIEMNVLTIEVNVHLPILQPIAARTRSHDSEPIASRRRSQQDLTDITGFVDVKTGSNLHNN